MYNKYYNQEDICGIVLGPSLDEKNGVIKNLNQNIQDFINNKFIYKFDLFNIYNYDYKNFISKILSGLKSLNPLKINFKTINNSPDHYMSLLDYKFIIVQVNNFNDKNFNEFFSDLVLWLEVKTFENGLFVFKNNKYNHFGTTFLEWQKTSGINRLFFILQIESCKGWRMPHFLQVNLGGFRFQQCLHFA